MIQTLKTKYSFVKLWLSLACVILAFIIFFWLSAIFYPTTDDSYVNANIIQISSQITAPVAKVMVEDHQFVHKGQLLALLDAKPFEISLQKALADLANAQLIVKAEQSAVNAAKAETDQALSQYQVAQKNVPRILTLVKEGKIAQAEGVKAQGDLDSAKARYQAAVENLNEAQEKLGQSIANNPQILIAQANVEQAKLDLSYTRLIAPADGTLVHFNLRPGTLVMAQQILFSIVESAKWWVDANFKETDMKRIHLGQTANIFVDLYPGIKFKGVVEGISIGSGAAFSLLPPENATGNWVKVTQRFTVRVGVDNINPHYPLRVGASAEVKIDTL